MKKLLLITTVIAAYGALQMPAQAQSTTSNFEGFSVGVNGELATGTSTASDGSSSSSQRGDLGLQARYGWGLGSNFVLGLGATADLGKRPAGSYASGLDVYSSQTYSLDIEPGYALNKNLLLYGKASTLVANVSSDDGSGTTPVQGVGLGIGLRGVLNSNTYWQAGLDNYRLNDATLNTGTTASLRGNVLSVGVGYRF